MNWHEFIFSNQPRQRYRRYGAFWLVWLLYIAFTIFFTERQVVSGLYHHQPGLNELGYFQYSLLVLIKSFLLLLTHLVFCYTVISFLLPGFLLKKKYMLFLACMLVLLTLMVPLGYFLYSVVYPFVDRLFNLSLAKLDQMIVWRSIDAVLINAIKVTLAASAITLLKGWWLKQKHKEKLEREKINAELQLLKAQMHPTFLFSTLDNIIAEARITSPKAPQMLIKLSDLLSYMLYECDAPKVKLEKEIGMIREYMALEKARYGQRVEMTFQLNGNVANQMISPLLLLPFIDYSFACCNNSLVEQAWLNVDITVDDNELSMKVINGIPASKEEQEKIDERGLENIKKRLSLLYPGKHELKINAEQELIMVYLKLKFEEAIFNSPPSSAITKTIMSHA